MQNDEQPIRQLVATWLSAARAGDSKKVLSLMAEDVVFLTPGQPPMRGKAAFAASQAGLGEARIDATSEIQEVKGSGEWVWLWTALIVVVTPKKGAPVRRRSNTLSILQRSCRSRGERG
jgi:uncharacterized protein (TIGR02246 family)